ncbi:MAG: methyltransferase domain-containing protein [Chloroflexota bacterium]|nr:MAG: methyltransferase domain-containing protein [Chloroflexota bacterium]
MTENRRFSFGRNWQKYLDDIPPGATAAMQAYVADWLGPSLLGKSFLDIGSGQGLTSLSAHALGADVTSFDVDRLSVAATSRLHEHAGRPSNWRILEGSILDHQFVSQLGKYEVVGSWGVLHHTGALWEALAAAAGLVADGGYLWIALYHRTRQSGRSLVIKRSYAGLPGPGRRVFRAGYAIAKIIKSVIVRRRLPNLNGAYDARGMNWWRDIEDWLGGLPYEVSSPGEVLAHLKPLGFELIRLEDAIAEAGNDVYLFRRTP